MTRLCLLPGVGFFFNDTATTEIYTLSLHDALPISAGPGRGAAVPVRAAAGGADPAGRAGRSEEHTSELQSQFHLVCRLLLEKKNSRRRRRCASSRQSGGISKRTRSATPPARTGLRG